MEVVKFCRVPSSSSVDMSFGTKRLGTFCVDCPVPCRLLVLSWSKTALQVTATFFWILWVIFGGNKILA